MSQNNHEKINRRFDTLRDKAQRDRDAFREMSLPIIHIGMASCGIASGALETKTAFEETLTERKIDARIHPVGCIGHCYGEPVVIIENPGFPPIFSMMTTGSP